MRSTLILVMLLIAGASFSQETDSVHTVVDVPAEFPGGSRALMQWMRENVNVPSSVYVEPGCNKVRLKFTVEADGRITGLQSKDSDSPELDAYMLTVFADMPRWTPASVDGKPVRSAVSLPVYIRISD